MVLALLLSPAFIWVGSRLHRGSSFATLDDLRHALLKRDERDIILILVGRTSNRVGHRVFKSYHGRLLPARSELLRGENDELLSRLRA